MDVGERIYRIYSENGITSKCYAAGIKPHYTVISKKLYETEENERAFDARIKLAVPEEYFVCSVFYRGLRIGYVDFIIMKNGVVYIEGLYRERANIQSLQRQLNKPSLFNDIHIGKLLLFHALYQAKKGGATITGLIPLDDNTGRLYKYYYDLGYRCVDINQRDEPIENMKVNDYVPQLGAADKNVYGCYFMVAPIDKILEKCC